MRQRAPRGKPNTICSKCRGPRTSPNNRYCRSCKAEYARTHRKPYSEFSPEQKLKVACRAKTRMAIRRGILVIYPCQVCGGVSNIEAHHPDYSKYLEVNWFCRICHREHHQKGLHQNWPLAPVTREVRPRSPNGTQKVTCSRCEKPLDRKGRYCKKCNAEKVREHRKKNVLQSP